MASRICEADGHNYQILDLIMRNEAGEPANPKAFCTKCGQTIDVAVLQEV